MTALLVALGAGIGASLRFVWARALDDRWPWGTLLVNVVGSGLFGFFAARSLSDQTWALAATGFCGALTSFSSFAVQAVERPPRLSVAYAAATTVGSVAACVLGFALGSIGQA